MQTIIIFNGSPRKKGNTSSLTSLFINKLNSDRYIAKEMFLYDQNINPCTDCRVCKKGDLICKVNDDMQKNYDLLDKADIFVIATPIYWFGPTAKMKLFLDRFRPYYGNQRLKYKKSLLILPAGVGEKDCDLTIEMFSRAFRALGVEYFGSITSKAYDIGDSLKDEAALQSVIEAAEGL